MGRRATSEEQKNAKRESILEATRKLYADRSFDEVDIATVAIETGIAKGTVYLYFRTKEEIFLELHRQAYAAWFRAMKEGLSDPGIRHSIPKVVRLFGTTLAERPEMLGLISILHTRLEQNISPDVALVLKQEMKEGVVELGHLLEEQLGFLMPGEGTMLLSRTEALIIGLSHLAKPAPVIAVVIERDDMALFRVDLPSAIAEMLTVMLMGLKSRGKQF